MLGRSLATLLFSSERKQISKYLLLDDDSPSQLVNDEAHFALDDCGLPQNSLRQAIQPLVQIPREGSSCVIHSIMYGLPSQLGAI